MAARRRHWHGTDFLSKRDWHRFAWICLLFLCPFQRDQCSYSGSVPFIHIDGYYDLAISDLALACGRVTNRATVFDLATLPPPKSLTRFLPHYCSSCDWYTGHNHSNVVFFQIWPTKGYQYLLAIAPPLAVLASRTLIRWLWIVDPVSGERRINTSWIRILVGGVMILSLLNASWLAIQPATSGTFIAGSGGVPGGREAGEWIRENLPADATLLAIGPSMANIFKFYGHRQALGLSVSPNPLHRNPAYEPVNNPDLQIRSNNIQYLVWDSYSAERSTFFSEKLLQLTARFHGRVIHTQTVTVTLDDGSQVEKPVIIIYTVHP